MLLSRGFHVTMTSLLLFGVLLAGCAKRPATTQASAPAPTAAAATTGSGPAMAQPTTAAPSGGGDATTAPATAAPSTATPAARPAVAEFRSVPELRDVFFDFDKYDIRPADAKVLDSNATWLKTNANNLILIEGHCDERGTNEYNLALGERRADAVRDYLVSLGVATDRMTVLSKGEEQPFCQEETEACWQQNRRGHFLVTAR